MTPQGAPTGVFDLYSACYDLLYRSKDYAAETQYLLELIDAAAAPRQPLRLLEFGCGTGGHALQLASTGRRVHGIDLSARMVSLASARAAGVDGLQFEVGDLRSCRLAARFDAVFSLFHVISYQTGPGDLGAAFATARAHLDRGGVFVFDCWYGPAVLSDRPRHEVRRVDDERISVQRRTTPTMLVNRNCVDVQFDIEVRPRDGGAARTFGEVHRMRYLFLPEIESALEAAGFELVSAQRWMTHEPLDDRSWYACIVARAA